MPSVSSTGKPSKPQHPIDQPSLEKTGKGKKRKNSGKVPSPKAHTEETSPQKQRRIERGKSEAPRSLATALPGQLISHIESYLEPQEAARFAQSSQDVRNVHVARALFTNPHVAGKLAVMSEDEIPKQWKDQLVAQRDSIKTIVLPQPSLHLAPPGPPGIEDYIHGTTERLFDHIKQTFANILRNTPQVQNIDLSNFLLRKRWVWRNIEIPQDALHSLSRLPNLRNIIQFDLKQHQVEDFVAACKENGNLKLEYLDIVDADGMTEKHIEQLFTFPLQSLSLQHVNSESALLELAKHGQHVTSLGIELTSYYGIMPETIHKISQSFPNLTRLTFSISSFDRRTYPAWLEAFGKWIQEKNLPGLVALQLPFFEGDVTTSICQFPRPLELNLQARQATDEDIAKLAQTKHYIDMLDLSHNPTISDKALEHIAKNAIQVSHLDVSNTNTTDVGIRALCSSPKIIEKLNLFLTKMSDAAVHYLATSKLKFGELLIGSEKLTVACKKDLCNIQCEHLAFQDASNILTGINGGVSLSNPGKDSPFKAKLFTYQVFYYEPISVDQNKARLLEALKEGI